MEKTIKLMGDGNVPVEDLFKGNYSVHKVADLEDTYCYVKEEKQPPLKDQQN